MTADSFATKSMVTEFAPIAYQLLSQAYALYEESSMDSKPQHRCVVSMMGTIMVAASLSTNEYETLITKTAQFSAKLINKSDQCQMVAQAARLFYPVKKEGEMQYSNAQRALECLQRSLKLADNCTTTNPAHIQLFVDLLEHYLFFFENKNPLITDAYINGLVALIKEHLNNLGGTPSVRDAKNHFLAVLREIRRKKNAPSTAALFAAVQVDNV